MERNERTRNELESIFEEFSKNPPLFCQVEIQHIKNHKWSEDGKDYVGEVEIIGFFDFNKEPIKKRTNIIKKEEVKKEQYYPPPSYNYSVYNASRSSDGNIYYQRSEGTKKNSKFLQSSGGGIIGGALGAGAAYGGGYALSSIAVALGSTAVASGPGLPVVLIGAGIGLGIGALFGLFK